MFYIVINMGRNFKLNYYEILSRTPLTAKQCQDSIRLGKARQVSKPIRKVEPTEYDLNYEDPDLYDFIAD